jgi:hypothetical protein
MYKTNTPNYVKSFNDFGTDNKEDLKKIKKSITKNDSETKQIIGNKKLYFNPITKKMDDLSPEEINDKLIESNIKSFKEFN